MLQVLGIYYKSDKFRSVLDYYSQLSVFVARGVMVWNDLNNIPSILNKGTVYACAIFCSYNNMQ